MNKEVKNKELIIFGIKNMAIEIKEIASTYFKQEFCSIKTIYFNDSFVEDNNLENKINRKDYTIHYIIGFGGTKRKECIAAMKKYINFVPYSIIHPSAIIAETAKIGEGCFIQPNTTISSNVIMGDHCVINYNASVGHDSILADNIFIQPGARVSGNCNIGTGTMLGSNSFILQNVTVGEDCLIDALTYIHDDLQKRMIVSSRYDKPVSRDEVNKNKISMWK